MSEFIRRDDAIAELENAKVIVSGMRFGKCILSEYAKQLREGFVDVLRNVPEAVEVKQVVHAKWLVVGKTEKGSRITKCSHCGVEKKNHAKTAYCPDCGAIMDLED